MSIEKLRELTEKLPRLEDIARSHNNGIVEYDVEKGESFGLNLLNIPEISVSRTFFEAGTVFPVHSHTEKEWLIVYRGRGIFTLPHGEIECGPGDSLVFAPDQEHGFHALENTWLLAIAIPSGGGWPDGEGPIKLV